MYQQAPNGRSRFTLRARETTEEFPPPKPTHEQVKESQRFVLVGLALGAAFATMAAAILPAAPGRLSITSC